MGIDVPTSCRKQGKCKECMVEVGRGDECPFSACRAREPPKGQLSPFLSGSRHRRGRPGPLPHHAARSYAHRAPCLRTAYRRSRVQTRSAVTRDRDRILIDGVEIARSTGPLLGIAMDLGTTTIVLRLVDLETGELIADTSFENPQRFGGSEVMSRIAYDTEHPGRLLMRTLAGYLSHASKSSPSIRRQSTRWS